MWLTGSQQFQVMRGVSETLAGRVAILNLLGFSRRERHRRDLDVPPFLPTPAALAPRVRSHATSQLKRVFRDIWMGGFPALAVGDVTDHDLFYRSYVQTYLQRDVRDLAQVGDQSAFLRFLTACAARTAQLLNLSDLARDADVSVNTAKAWLSILEGSFQVMRLPPYHTNITSRLVKAPKLYFLDTRAFYYRDRDGREIDLLLLKDRTIYPIEIKKTTQPSPAVARSFQALDRLPLTRGAGAVVCFSQQVLPLDKRTNAVPAGLL